MSTVSKWIIGVLCFFLFVQFVKYCNGKQEESRQYEAENPPEPEAAPSTTYTFTLTKLLNKPLVKPATFTVDTKSTDWVLNFNNGTSLTYTIISGSESDPLCGLQVRDSYGDKAVLCINKGSDDNVTVVFNYSGKRLVYSGKFVR